jgi:uncharacterized repeat protein (TIGR01451 family)
VAIINIRQFSFVKFLVTVGLTFLFSFAAGGGLPWLFSQPAKAHNVAQVQTAKYFAPETVTMLKDRLASGGAAGLQSGDTVSYIIQFSPVANDATIGSGGYVTDYIPDDTQVVDAAIVQPDGSGGFVSIPPDLPGPMSGGWGPKNTTTFNNWNASTGAGSLAQIYADTGIFYSTNLRTKVFPTSGRISQNGNGYNINPTAASQLTPYFGLLSTAIPTTHNQWDADQTNAFGTDATNLALITTTPKSNQVIVVPSGKGATPYNAGSAVAGPDSGYKLDNTGSTGPWNRIAYSGSRVGNPTGPATSILASPTSSGVVNSSTAVVGDYISSGASFPLPAATNAVRWALGRLVVGQTKYVKLSLKLTANPLVTGVINNSEVFGGDSAEAAGKVGNDNPWRYHVPSVADNNSNLYLYKEIECVYSGTPSTCKPITGTIIPASARIRYRITYLNTGSSTQTNVILSDKLPSQTAANSVSNATATVVSGPNILPFTPLNPAAGSPTAGGDTITFATIPSLTAGSGGVVTLEVLTNVASVVPSATKPTSANVVVNKAQAQTTDLSGITSKAVASALSIASLAISKTVSPSSTQAGSIVTYTLKIENTSPVAATNLRIYDFLPTSGGSTANDRFNLATAPNALNTVTVTGTSSGITSITAPTTTTTALLAPFTGQNRQQVLWNFGASSSLAAGASFTIQFKVQVGSNVPNLITPYTNDARVIYDNGSSDTEANASATAPVIVVKSADLSITKMHLPAQPTVGGAITYTIIATNSSTTVSVANAAIKDNVPSTITNVSWTCAASLGSSCGLASGMGNALNATTTLAPSGTATFTILGTVDAAATGTIPNTATVTTPLNISDPIPGDNTVQDNFTLTSSTPELRLIKRISSIQRGTPAIEQLSVSYVDVTTDANDNAAGWPNQIATATKEPTATPDTSNFSTLLEGIVTSSTVQPKDTVEYRIYFLSSGTGHAQNASLCDFIPKNSSYVSNSTALVFNSATIPISDTTNTDTDGGFHPASTVTFPSPCSETNYGKGAISVNIGSVAGSIFKSTGAGTPGTSYGYVRFRTKVD